MDCQISGPQSILSGFRGSPSLFRTNLFRNDQFDSARATLLADLCSSHSLPLWTFGLDRIQSDLASPQAAGFNRIATVPTLPGLQSTLGGSDTYQSGMDSLHFLSVVFWLYCPRFAQSKQIPAQYHLCALIFVGGSFTNRVFHHVGAFAFPFYLGHYLRTIQ